MGFWSVKENFEKGFQLKIREKGLIFGGKIRDKGVAFILWDKHENKHLLKCSRQDENMETLQKIPYNVMEKPH